MASGTSNSPGGRSATLHAACARTKPASSTARSGVTRPSPPSGPRGARLERDRQRLQPAERQAQTMLGLFDRERELRQLLDERADRDLAFHAREWRADAEVDAPAERNVAVVGATEIQTVGLRKLSGIAIRGADEGEHHVALGNRASGKRDVLAGNARGPLDRAVVAKQLLDRSLDQRRVLAQPSKLFGMAQERQGPVADQVDGRFMPRDEEQDARGQQLGLAELVPRFLGRDEGR